MTPGQFDDIGRNEWVPRAHRRHLPTPSKSALARRAGQIGWTMARHFGPLTIRQLRGLRDGILPAATIARPLRLIVEDLGGTFMKFGQLLASSPGLFGDEVADEFRSCLDTGPAVAFTEVRRRVEDDLGCSLDDVFVEFDVEPIGRASIAVVHRARLIDGREVAVKVLRPGIEHLVAVDLDLMQPMFAILARETGDQMAGSILQLLDGLRQQLGEELDLRNEARAMAHFRKLKEQIDLPLVVVPEPFPEFSGPNVLTMEFLHGVPVDDVSQVAALGYDPAPLVEQIVRGFFVTTVRWGAFHGDVHAGNLLLLSDGRIGIIDWGIVGRLDHDTHQFLLRLLDGVLGDETAWPEVTSHLTRTYGRAIQEGLGLDDEGLTSFFRNLIEPTLTRPFGEVSLAHLIAAPQAQAARGVGAQAQGHPVRTAVARIRAQRRMRRIADEAGGLMSEFERGTFLLGKQLMYFERYGKLFMADQPLMADREFFVELLAGAPRRGL